MATATESVGHFQPRANILRRSQGDSAAGKAAYNARTRIENERTGKVYSFEHLTNPVLAEHFYPAANSPEWANTRAGYWNGVEMRENRTDSQLAMDWIIDLPHQMQQSPDHARMALQDFIRENFTRKGYSADLAFHPAHDHGDERNFHAHLMVGIRRFEKDGTWAKVKDGVPDPQQLDELRERMAKTLNNHLKRHGYDIRVDHRSYEARGIDREATNHLGKHAAALERRGIETEPGNVNREIEERNAQRDAERRRIHELVEDLTPQEVELTLDRLRREDQERAAERGRASRYSHTDKEIYGAVRRLFTTMGAELGNVIPIDASDLARSRVTYTRDVDEERRRAATQAAQDEHINRVLQSIAKAEPKPVAVSDQGEKAAQAAIEQRRRVQEQLAAHREGLEAALEREGYTRPEQGRKAEETGAQREREAAAEARELAASEDRRRVQEQLAAYRAGLEAQLAKERGENHRDENTAQDPERKKPHINQPPASPEPKPDIVRDREAGDTRPSDRAQTWIEQTGGYDQLSDKLKAAARKSYDKWAEKKPEQAKRLSIEGYVAYTQEQEQKRRIEREAASRGATEADELKQKPVKRPERKLHIRRGRRPRRPEDEPL